jgi:hypothetical protein
VFAVSDRVDVAMAGVHNVIGHELHS